MRISKAIRPNTFNYSPIEPRGKFEVVFFPYQLAMFDSFRSVYLAAKKDPDCAVYCVPIPWFDKKPSGELSDMHYDGDKYPPDIEISDWREYNVEERHPDVVFIHNPYDEYNAILTVHHNYYCSVLRNKTRLLVYIPYGLQYNIKSEVEDGNIENADLPAGFVLSDMLISHAEKRTERLRYLLKHKYPSLTQPEIVTLGSPKFDMVINSKREDYVLPEKWQRLIAGKKVMLFSTSCTSILRGNEKFLESLRNMFNTFRKRSDIVLWWRPHPLSEETFSSMRPRLLNDYKNMVKEYIADGSGIYDDTPDLHRAISWSDGCYTNESSLQFLYLATGKPFTVRGFPITSPPPDKAFKPLKVDGFAPILQKRIENMQAAKGANVLNRDCVIWWANFAGSDCVNNLYYVNFVNLFIDFIVNEDKYPQAELYRQLKLKMLQDVVENADGTAGQKIYEYVKKKIFSKNPD